MGYSGYGSSNVVPAHQHGLAAGDGGQLSTNATRITNFSPLSLVVGLS